MTRAKEQVTCKMKWRNSCITVSRNCSAGGKGGVGMTTKAGGLTRGCAHESPQRSLREIGNAPIKTRWAEQPGKPNVRARWVAKEYKTHARPVLYTSTPPEALKAVLSEIASGKRGGKVAALVDVRMAYFHALARRRLFVELPPEDHQAGDEHMCGLLRYSLCGDAAQKWEEERDLQDDERERVPVRVARLHQGRTHCGNRATGTTSRLVENDRRRNFSSK